MTDSKAGPSHNQHDEMQDEEQCQRSTPYFTPRICFYMS